VLRKIPVERYKCFMLTVIAVFLGGLLWRSPPTPLMLEQVRTQQIKGGPLGFRWFVGGGDIDVEVGKQLT